MPHTHSLLEIAEYIEGILNSNKEAMGIQNVIFGDQDNVAPYPAVCIEPSAITSDKPTMTERVENNFLIYLLVYHSRVQAAPHTRKQADRFAENVKAFINTDRTMGDKVIYGYVAGIEYGYAARDGAIVYSSRIEWFGMNKILI